MHLDSGLVWVDGNISVISSELYFFVPYTQACIRIDFYVRKYILAFDAELISGEGIF